VESSSLYQRIVSKCGSALTAIGATRIEQDTSFANHNVDIVCFSNARVRFSFTIDPYDEEFVYITPLNHDGDQFSVKCLLEIVSPEQRIERGFSSVQSLPSVVERVYALFESQFYKCYRRAYDLFENCRNLIGIKGAGWD
jgi:hypothetical protein